MSLINCLASFIHSSKRKSKPCSPASKIESYQHTCTSHPKFTIKDGENSAHNGAPDNSSTKLYANIRALMAVNNVDPSNSISFDDCIVHRSENVPAGLNEKNENAERDYEIIPSKQQQEDWSIVVGEREDESPDKPSCIRSIPSICCRICQMADNVESFISPCLCSGTIAFVHRTCLERWLNTSGLIHCELCLYRFPVKMKLRYSLLQSLRLWYRHPNNRDILQADMFVCSLISLVTFGIIGMSLLGLHFLRNNHFGISLLWTKGCLILFLIIVCMSYLANIFLILKAQLKSWYRWWQSAREVKLLLINKQKSHRDKFHNRIMWKYRSRRRNHEHQIRVSDI